PEPTNCKVVEPPTEPEPKPPGAYPKECEEFDAHDQKMADLCCATDWEGDSPAACQVTCDDTIVPAAYCCDGTVDPEPKVCSGFFNLTQNELDSTLKILGVTL
ncbi:MAG: hypothetical protein DRQ89_06935, partial [Epsilonproteobacteria bacterium]